jgi:hypothetical protein
MKDVVCVNVDPGICGFICSIKAWKEEKILHFDIQSDCKQIQKLSSEIGPMKMRDFFVPLTKNLIFLSAEKAKCHLACPIPTALIKCAEVVLELALPKDVQIHF